MAHVKQIDDDDMKIMTIMMIAMMNDDDNDDINDDNDNNDNMLIAHAMKIQGCKDVWNIVSILGPCYNDDNGDDDDDFLWGV